MIDPRPPTCILLVVAAIVGLFALVTVAVVGDDDLPRWPHDTVVYVPFLVSGLALATVAAYIVGRSGTAQPERSRAHVVTIELVTPFAVVSICIVSVVLTLLAVLVIAGIYDAKQWPYFNGWSLIHGEFPLLAFPQFQMVFTLCWVIYVWWKLLRAVTPEVEDLDREERDGSRDGESGPETGVS